MSIWDDPELKTADAFVTFEKVGDSVTGRVTAVRLKTFTEDGKTRTAPQIFLLKDDGTEVCLTAGQATLRAILSRERPDVGDLLYVKYTGNERVPGRPSPKKLFEVRVKRGEPAPVAVSAPQYDTPPF